MADVMLDSVTFSQKNKEIINRLKPIVAKILRIPEDELLEDSPLINYGVSSLMTLVLVQKINKNFGIQFMLEEISMNQSISSLTQLICTKLSQLRGDVNE